jgi:hypothetical protein
MDRLDAVIMFTGKINFEDLVVQLCEEVDDPLVSDLGTYKVCKALFHGGFKSYTLIPVAD